MDPVPAKVTLSCRPEFPPGKLRLNYALSNGGAEDCYVLDLLPGIDPESKQAVVDVNKVYLCATAGGALILKGIPPLPQADVKARVMPLGTKLPPGQTLERRLELALPLREQSPYYAPLPDKDHDLIKVRVLFFVVQYLRATAEEFAAEPSALGPNLFCVRSKHTVGHAESLRCQLDVRETPLLKRRDRFVRL
jgi:hypothetical protein